MTKSPPSFVPLDNQKWNGLRVGILGGSFNPPHEGHIHISRIAMNMLGLDYIWWLVSPQNPLKQTKAAEYDDRFQACCDLTKHSPNIIVTDFERRLGISYTAETVFALRKHYPKTKFVWVMGMDNALTFHTWERWKDILATMATAHIARPPFYNMVEESPLRNLSTQRHVFLQRGRKVSLESHTSYWIMQNHLMDISSTEIRLKTNN